jgi:hypothetical protein
MYADNIKYLNLISVEEFGGTIEAYTFPNEFYACDGTVDVDGMSIGQQPRSMFGFTYRTRLGNDVDGDQHGYKIHIVYGALAQPSERAYATVNDSPEAMTLSWTFTTTPLAVTGMANPVALITIDSTRFDPTGLSDLEDLLYGTVSTDAELPTPETIAGLGSALTTVTPTVPTFVAATGVITIPTQTGVVYKRADTGATVTGTVTIGTPGASLIIRAYPTALYNFTAMADNDWSYTRDP